MSEDATGSGAAETPDGFVEIGSGGGLTCSTCGSYVWRDDLSLQVHRDWHQELDAKTRPPSAGARDRALGSHFR
ncbi:hypothetical protein ASG91_03445 [Phycicoccus sp. Soil802]|nr:hypothetical protein ASG91_03445 [Phycicoccus sp. Soil802]